MSESPVSSRPAALRLSQTCDLCEVRATAGAVRQFLATQGCDEAELNSCELALVEACNNAIKYTQPATAHKPIVVDCLCDALRVELRVHDHTRGFDWSAEASLPDDESESGRGLYLIRTLMDTANYFRAADENVLVLHKQRAHGAIAAPPAADSDRVITEMVEELSSCYESLSAIFRYRAAQANVGELKEFAERLLADLLQITSADWFVLRLTPKGEARLEVFAVSEPALQLAPLVIAAAASEPRSVELAAANSRRVVWFDEAHPLPSGDPLAVVKPGSHGLVHPIFTGENLVGTLTIGKRAPVCAAPAESPRLVFTAGQTNVVGTFTEFLAIQVVNARFQEERVASRLVAHELEIANNIQQSLLPKELPLVPGLQLAASCRSAYQVGGDFYDVLRISDHEILLVIADVMGKGVPAAMFAVILRTMVRAAPELACQPSALLTRVNRLLFDELSGVDMFITAQLGYLDATARCLITASAGHCPLLVMSSVPGAGVKEVSPEGMPLGIMADTMFVEESIQLPPQCRVLFYTDGLPEALNGQGERFGHERLVEWFQTAACRPVSAAELKHSLGATMGRFQANMVLNDDQTFLIMSG
jgi:serine phosphatase RsbU (regulator of sigma subunit)/anti-sigma regulatory factor (Ser/Thr protein kinase)